MQLFIHSKNGISVFETKPNTRLFDELTKNGFVFSAPCGGAAVCGGCAVKAIGELSPPSEQEKLFLKDKLKYGYRLACFAFIKGDVTVFEEDLQLNTASVEYKYTPPAPITGKDECIACAVDIGTTSVFISAVRLPSGDVFDTACFFNPQSVFGADVMTRISNSSDKKYLLMKKEIDRVTEGYFAALPEYPKYCVIVGNTTMLYLAAGQDPTELGRAPFAAKNLFGVRCGARYYAPCLSAFVGSDLLASVLSSGITQEKSALLMDIGTNCELALWNGKELFCTSAPAGPAFEGHGISNGMTASEGAISAIRNNGGAPSVVTVGNKAPVGICGSGLVDAVAFLKENSLLNRDGTIVGGSFDFCGITVDSSDVAQLQLAKSAIYSAAQCLAQAADINMSDIEKICFCGNFGSFLSPHSCASVGIIPSSVENKVEVLGNSALAGALQMVLNDNYRKKIEELSTKAKVLELGGNSDFEEKFLKNLTF